MLTGEDIEHAIVGNAQMVDNMNEVHMYVQECAAEPTTNEY